jgi:hypothetical protein
VPPHRRSRESGNPGPTNVPGFPAFAGMTTGRHPVIVGFAFGELILLGALSEFDAVLPPAPIPDFHLIQAAPIDWRPRRRWAYCRWR